MKYFRSEAFFAGGHTVPSRYVLGNVQSEDAFIYDNKKRTSVTDSFIYTIICEDILMRCAANSIFDCAGVLKCTPSNQIIEVCKQVAK